MHADTILVIEAGEIVERGRHDELLRRGRRYPSSFGYSTGAERLGSRAGLCATYVIGSQDQAGVSVSSPPCRSRRRQFPAAATRTPSGRTGVRPDRATA